METIDKQIETVIEELKGAIAKKREMQKLADDSPLLVMALLMIDGCNYRIDSNCNRLKELARLA